MGDWKRVCRCKECGKIYPSGIPLICKKCGTEIGRMTPYTGASIITGEVTLTEKCEKVMAKQGIWGWKVQEREDDGKNEDVSKMR